MTDAERLEEALEVLVTVMQNVDNPPQARAAAASALVDRLTLGGAIWTSPRLERDAAYRALEAERDQLKAARDKAVNMARHNYWSAVHEQLHASAHGHPPSPDYPPLVDDEFAAACQRAEAAEAQLIALRQQIEALPMQCADARASGNDGPCDAWCLRTRVLALFPRSTGNESDTSQT